MKINPLYVRRLPNSEFKREYQNLIQRRNDINTIIRNTKNKYVRKKYFEEKRNLEISFAFVIANCYKFYMEMKSNSQKSLFKFDDFIELEK